MMGRQFLSSLPRRVTLSSIYEIISLLRSDTNMKKGWLFFALFISIGCLSLADTGDHTDVKNLDSDRPFRMSKTNMVWEKARKILKDKKLSDLYSELVVQDRNLKLLKVKQHDGEDEDGLFEAETRADFLRILRKYHIEDYFPDERNMKKDKRSEFKRPGKPERHEELRDEKLKKLWKIAKSEGFSASEMDRLKEELTHHQLKLDEYETLKTNYETLKDNVDNSLDNLDEQEDYWKKLDKTKKEMKDKYAEVKEHYVNLKQKMKEGEAEQPEFNDPRVYHLWALAKQSGMSPDELKSIKKELTHFEHRIMKTQAVQDRVKKSEQKLNMNDPNHNVTAHAELVEKVKHYNKKVDKYHEDLKFRIQRRLDEL